jgi:hypothetical protein
VTGQLPAVGEEAQAERDRGGAQAEQRAVLKSGGAATSG